MDMVFLLDEETRSTFIRSVLRMLHWRYICLWSYQPSLPAECLLFLDGYYEDEAAAQARSSAGSFGRRLFNAYSGTVCAIDSRVPGLAFKEGRPYLMLAEDSLQVMATTEAQRQFYQGAGIKYAVFLACRSGEIEIGTTSNKVNVEMEDIRNLFTEDMIKEFGLASLHQFQERSRSSSSTTLRSVSLGSHEYSSGLLPMISSPLMFHAPVIRNPTAIQPRPSPHMVDDALTKAMLAVLSSSAPSSASSSPSSFFSQFSAQGRAFQKYSSASSRSIFFHRTSLENQYLPKLSVAILRAINNQRTIQSGMVENQPTASQLSHLTSERKRREKLNESFQALRALLPPGSKKDKASTLAGARETMTALRAEVSELERRNQVLQAQSTSRPTSQARRGEQESTSGDQGRDVTVTEIRATPEEREIELRIRKPGRQFELMDLVLRLLGCIRGLENVELMAVSADLQQAQQQRTVVLRLKIKGTEWSRSMFEETVARELVD